MHLEPKLQAHSENHNLITIELFTLVSFSIAIQLVLVSIKSNKKIQCSRIYILKFNPKTPFYGLIII